MTGLQLDYLEKLFRTTIMKKILPLCVFLLASTVLAQATKKEPPKKEPPEKRIPLCEDYENVLKNYGKWSTDISNPEYKNYKDMVFTEPPVKKDEKPKTIKLKDLSALQRDAFYLYQAEICSTELALLTKAWEQEFRTALNPISEEDKKKLEEKYKDKPALKKPPTRVQIVQYLARLFELRKKHAVKFEALVKETFKKHEEDIPAIDRQRYLKKIKAWNDAHRLIDRNKKV